MFTHKLLNYKHVCKLLNHISFKPSFTTRGFLSSAYECRDAWDRRLQDPVINKIKLENFYVDLELKLNANKPVSAVDVDVFANRINNDEYLLELEELIHRFRRTPNTIHTLESTSHAVIRAFLDYGSTDILMRILNDRVNYGIFPDHFTYNLLMNRFIKQENYRDAAKCATFLMLQEDFENPLTNSLALYSCFMYLEKRQPEPWDPDSKQEKEDDDDEEVWVRVNFLPLPYFDDHFDLRNPNHLIGKTIVQLSKQKVVEDPVLRGSSELLGWTLFEKWDQVTKCAEQILGSKDERIFKKSLDKALQVISEVTAGISDEQLKQKIQQEIEPLLQKLESKTINDEPQKILEDLVKTQVSLCEKKEVEKICETYSKWSELRQKEVENQVQEILKQEKLKEINEKLEEIKKREERLFFFENLEKHRLNIPPEEEDQLINEEGKVSAKALLDVPPEIEGKTGRYSSKVIEEHEPWWRWKENKTQTDENAANKTQ